MLVAANMNPIAIKCVIFMMLYFLLEFQIKVQFSELLER
jgi:hypothetical protein